MSDTDLHDTLLAMISRHGRAAVLRALGSVMDDAITRRLIHEATLIEAWREEDTNKQLPDGPGCAQWALG
jgi:hypothetical protein